MQPPKLKDLTGGGSNGFGQQKAQMRQHGLATVQGPCKEGTGNKKHEKCLEYTGNAYHGYNHCPER